MDRDKLLELASRVEAAEGPDRELDAEIAHTTRWRWDGWEDGDIQIEDRPLEYVKERVGRSLNSVWQNLPRYTASLGASASLVSDKFASGGVRFQVEQWNTNGVHAPHVRASAWVAGAARVYAASTALALSAAALRALAQGDK